MGEANDVNPYLRDAVLTATPEQLQLMLYDGAIRFATQGRAAIERKDWEACYQHFTRAQNIVLEMHNGLRPEVNAELCSRMAALYMFIYRKLIDANVYHQLEAVDDALKILRMERETWQMVCDKVAAERSAQSSSAAGAAEGEPVGAAGSFCAEG